MTPTPWQPDLAALPAVAIEAGTGVRPFDGDRLADFDFLRDATREVAERFDEKVIVGRPALHGDEQRDGLPSNLPKVMKANCPGRCVRHGPS